LNSGGDLASFDGTTWHSFGVLALAGGGAENFVRAAAVDPNHPEIIYAATFAAGLPCVFRSIDSGAHWQDITYNLPRTGRFTIAVNPHTGEVLTGSAAGTWIFPAPYTSSNTLYNKSVSMPSCSDGLKNGDETGIDCGGSCPNNCVGLLYGDVSGDSEITAYDAALTAQASVGIITLTPGQITKADVSGDGEVSAYDAALIAQYSVGIIDHFPVEE